jgi:creatinine amidohydrolase
MRKHDAHLRLPRAAGTAGASLRLVRFGDLTFEEIAAAAAAGAIAVLPTVGTNGNAGSTTALTSGATSSADIPVPVYEQFVRAILDSLAGFARIVVWRGCGGHDLTSPVRAFNEDRRGTSRAVLPAQPFHAIWCSLADPSVPGGHADSFTTSILMHRRPDVVRRNRIPDGASEEPD